MDIVESAAAPVQSVIVVKRNRPVARQDSVAVEPTPSPPIVAQPTPPSTQSSLPAVASGGDDMVSSLTQFVEKRKQLQQQQPAKLDVDAKAKERGGDGALLARLERLEERVRRLEKRQSSQGHWRRTTTVTTTKEQGFS